MSTLLVQVLVQDQMAIPLRNGLQLQLTIKTLNAFGTEIDTVQKFSEFITRLMKGIFVPRNTYMANEAT